LYCLSQIFDAMYMLLRKTICGLRGLDRMVVGFTTTCALSAYHH